MVYLPPSRLPGAVIGSQRLRFLAALSFSCPLFLSFVRWFVRFPFIHFFLSLFLSLFLSFFLSFFAVLYRTGYYYFFLASSPTTYRLEAGNDRVLLGFYRVLLVFFIHPIAVGVGIGLSRFTGFYWVSGMVVFRGQCPFFF